MTDNLIQINPTGDAHPRSRFWLDWKRVKRIIVILSIALVAAYLVFNVWVYFWIQGKIVQNLRSPESVRIWRNYLQTTVCIPGEWRNVTLYSPAIEKEHNALYESWNRIVQKTTNATMRDIKRWNESILNSNEPMTRQDWEEVERIVEVCEPYYRAGKEMVEKLETEILKYPHSEHIPSFVDNNFYVNEWIQLVTLQSYKAAHEGRYRDTVDTLFSILPLYVRSPFPDFGEYAYKNFRIGQWASNLPMFYENVWDREKLQSWLDTLNRWEPYLFRMRLEHKKLYALYAALCDSKAPIEYDVDKKVLDYIREIKDREFPRKSIYQTFVEFRDRWFSELLAGALSNPYDRRPREIEMVRPFVLTGIVEEFYMMQTYVSDSTGYFQREQVTANQYDELRLNIAARLYYLENKKFPASPADLVPGYFSHEIVNRVTGESYRWSELGELIRTANTMPSR